MAAKIGITPLSAIHVGDVTIDVAYIGTTQVYP